VMIESGKILRQSATTIGPIMSPGELIKVAGYLSDLQRGESSAPRESDRPAIDYSKLSLDDLRKLHEADEVVRKVRG
jgi:hypothetical protein